MLYGPGGKEKCRDIIAFNPGMDCAWHIMHDGWPAYLSIIPIVL